MSRPVQAGERCSTPLAACVPPRQGAGHDLRDHQQGGDRGQVTTRRWQWAADTLESNWMAVTIRLRSARARGMRGDRAGARRLIAQGDGSAFRERNDFRAGRPNLHPIDANADPVGKGRPVGDENRVGEEPGRQRDPNASGPCGPVDWTYPA